MAAETPDLDALARKIEADGDASLPDIFDSIGLAARDVAKAIRANDEWLGEHASSAFLNAIELLPENLRQMVAESATERPGLAANPHLRRLAL